MFTFVLDLYIYLGKSLNFKSEKRFIYFKILLHFYFRKENDGKTYIKYQVIGASTVAVPTHFFKVIAMETPDLNYELEAYVMPNAPISDETPLHVFQVNFY